jgi:hypothetical protein
MTVTAVDENISIFHPEWWEISNSISTYFNDHLNHIPWSTCFSIQLQIAINQGKRGPTQKSEIISIYSTKLCWYRKRFTTCKVYMDKGRSILRFFFLANRTCFVTFMHKSNSIVMHTKINASRICLKYKETAEKTKNAMTTSSHITNTTTSTLQEHTGQRGETKSGSMSS